MDPAVQALQYLDMISVKDVSQKAAFYHNLPNVMPLIPKVT
jgi:hypothetical protein